MERDPCRHGERWAGVYGDAYERRRRRRLMRRKLRKLGLHLEERSSRVLDVCCGYGETLDVLHGMGFRELSGLDLHIPPSLADDPRFTSIRGDARGSGFTEAEFDAITCLHGLHHFEGATGVRRFLKESCRILRPGGRLYILDFENTVLLRLTLRLLRMNGTWPGSRFLTNLSVLVREEWPLIRRYQEEWEGIRGGLDEGGFLLEKRSRTPYYFYARLRKPLQEPARDRKNL